MKSTFLLSLAFVVASALPLSAQIASKIQTDEISGMDVFSYRTSLEDVVILRGSLPAGAVFDPPENPVISMLVAGMLDKGTLLQDKFALAARLERLGAEISFGGGSHEVSFSAQCLKEDLPVVLELLAEQLRQPAFQGQELEKLKQQMTAMVKRGLENPESRANLAFSRAIFPSGHPSRGHTAEEQLAGLSKATVEDLKKFHAGTYGPAHAKLVVAGDIDPTVLRAALAKAFAGWSGGRALPENPSPVRAGAAAEETVFIPGKTSVNLVWGQATGLRYTDRPVQALRVATAVFGTGFTGRLMASVRDKEGLTYGIGAGLTGDTYLDGSWRITATFAPALLERGVTSTRRELMLWYEKGITEKELAARKTSLIGGYQVGLATTEGLAETILTVVQRGLGVEWLDRYPQIIESLTLDEVNGAIRTYLNPANMVLIKAGTIQPAAASKAGS